MGQNKEIKQKLKRPENFDIFFPLFLASLTKVLFLEGKLGTRLCLQPTWGISLYFLVS